MEEQKQTDSEGQKTPQPDRFIRPFFEDTGLWPILAVLVLSLCTLGAAAILAVVLSGNLFALAALALVALLSIDIVVRSWRRPSSRLFAGCAVGFWLGSAALAALGLAVGIV